MIKGPTTPSEDHTDSTEKPTVPSPKLVALINTAMAQGYLTYLWPYADWVDAAIDEYMSRPTPLPPCETLPRTSEEPTTEDMFAHVQIESYYDDGDHDTGHGRKVYATCIGVQLQPRQSFAVVGCFFVLICTIVF